MTEANRDRDEESAEPNARGILRPAPEQILSDEAVREAIEWAKGSAVDDLIERIVAERSKSRDKSNFSA
jgi:hypothetical protein